MNHNVITRLLARVFALTAALILVAACSSNPSSNRPAWVSEPARIVDGGYIVYVAQGRGLNKEKAQFRAEGLALEDLANECSFLPKGTRIEDRYSEVSDDGQHFSAVKVGLEFQECSEAQKLDDPEKVREKASIAFTEQLKRFQDMEENGTEVADATPVQPAAEASSAPAQGGWNEQTHFYLYRQYVVYQKQVVILSPPGSYAPGTPALSNYNQSIATATPFISHYAETHPELAKSTQPPPVQALHPLMARPTNLAPANMGAGRGSGVSNLENRGNPTMMRGGSTPREPTPPPPPPPKKKKRRWR